ncbi:MAG: hypothetical protein ABI778_00785 [Ignavibacteriota bacterium]
MLRFTYSCAALFVLAAVFNLKLGAQTSSPSGTDVPRILSYQGQLTTTNGSVMNGTHRITASLYSDRFGKNSVWSGEYDAVVTDGLFSVILGAGKYKLPGNPEMNKALWIGVKVDGAEELKPLSQLAAAPYALNVPDKSITLNKLADEVTEGMYSKEAGTIKPTSANGGAGTVSTPNGCPSNDDGSVPLGTNEVAGGCGNVIFGSSGNHPIDFSTISGGEGNTITNVIPHNQTDEGSNWHTIGGGKNNSIRIDVTGSTSESPNMGSSTIAGGDSSILSGPWGFIGGGQYNFISNQRPVTDDDGGNLMKWDVIVGGIGNSIDTVSSGSFIGGGSGNHIAGTGTDHNPFNVISHTDNSFIGGGDSNTVKAGQSSIIGGEKNLIVASSDHSIIGGGFKNVIDTIVPNSFIGGGHLNRIRSSVGTIGGGENNYIHTNSGTAFIGGGSSDSIKSSFGTMGGGDRNLIDTGAGFDFVGGGRLNKIKSQTATIAGGDTNLIDFSSNGSFIGGGVSNKIQSESDVISGGKNNFIDIGSSYSSIGGGEVDTIYSVSTHAVIGGGSNNKIDTGSAYAVIGGGLKNVIETHPYLMGADTIPATTSYSFIGGGFFNQVLAPFNVIGGGDSNIIGFDIYNSSYSFIGGGQLDTIDPGSPNNVICGGWKNHNGGGWSMMGSGARNYIYDNSICDLIGAGRDNYIGNQNHIPLGKGINFSSIVGGDTNLVAASWSSIVGGKWNLIADASEYSFIGGGDSNTIMNNSLLATLGGGGWNTIKSQKAAVFGGCNHTIDTNSTYSFIGGGCGNYIFGVNSTIGGGTDDSIIATGGFIGGGAYNLIDAIDGKIHSDATIAGESRFGTIAGGLGNFITKLPLSEEPGGLLPSGYYMPYGVAIGGGQLNLATGHFSTVPGGQQDSALGRSAVCLGGFGLKAYDFQTVVGTFNSNIAKRLRNQTGDPFLTPLVLPDPNDDIFIVGNGTDADNRSNAFMVTNSGHSLVTHNNQSGGADGTGNHSPTYRGATYEDNVIYGWGYVKPIVANNPLKGVIVKDLGVEYVIRVPGTIGIFKIKLKIYDPIGDTAINLTQSSITVTTVDTTAVLDTIGGMPGFATASPIQADNIFYVKTYDPCLSLCITHDRPFYFKVVGRKEDW